MISRAFAAHFTPPSEGGGGAMALSIILGVGLLFLLLHIARKKLRARRSANENDPE